MASSKEYLDFILEQLSGLSGVAHRAMMGEFIIYLRGKIIGGIYDDRLLIKNTEAARRMMPDAPLETPYEGAKPYFYIEDVDDHDYVATLVKATCAALPEPKPKKKKQ